MHGARGFARIGAAAMLAAVGGIPTAGVGQADDPVLHQVTYTVFSEKPTFAEIYYRDTDPQDFAQYSHDPYVFSPNVEAQVGPDNKWVLNVSLINPDQWAMVTASSGRSPNQPNFHCVLAVDGVVVDTGAGPKGALCSIRNW